MLLYTIASEYDVFPFEAQNSVAIPIKNGMLYKTDGKFSGLFSTNPYDFLNLSNFQNGGVASGNNKQEKN